MTAIVPRMSSRRSSRQNSKSAGSSLGGRATSSLIMLRVPSPHSKSDARLKVHVSRFELGITVMNVVSAGPSRGLKSPPTDKAISTSEYRCSPPPRSATLAGVHPIRFSPTQWRAILLNGNQYILFVCQCGVFWPADIDTHSHCWPSHPGK